MIFIVLFLFFFLKCHSAQNFCFLSDPSFKSSFFCVVKGHLNEIFNLGLKPHNHKCQTGIYECEVTEEIKHKGKIVPGCFAAIREPRGFTDKKGAIEVIFDKDSSWKNLTAIFDKKRFENNGIGSTVVLSPKIIDQVPLQQLFALCLNIKSVQIALFNEDENASSRTFSFYGAHILDPGIEQHFKNMGYQRGFTLHDFIDHLQKLKKIAPQWYEKLFYWFDNQYYYTKACTYDPENAPLLTIRYSYAFRRNALKWVVMSLAVISTLAVLLKMKR